MRPQTYAARAVGLDLGRRHVDGGRRCRAARHRPGGAAIGRLRPGVPSPGSQGPQPGRAYVDSHTGTTGTPVKSGDMTVAISPHYEYPADGKWRVGGPAEQLLNALHMFERSGPLTVDDLPGSGADFLQQLKQSILDGPAIIASPHKISGPQTNDLALQPRKRGVSQIVLAGMAANLRVSRSAVLSVLSACWTPPGTSLCWFCVGCSGYGAPEERATGIEPA